MIRRGEEQERWDWRWYLLLLAVCVVLWTILGWAAYGVYSYLHTNRCQSEDHVVPATIKARMRYHGVQVVYEDWKGNNYFIRDGKRCPL
jgi:heme/copper-type cytochrome/quinol oxidase subunit 2